MSFVATHSFHDNNFFISTFGGVISVASFVKMWCNVSFVCSYSSTFTYALDENI